MRSGLFFTAAAAALVPALATSMADVDYAELNRRAVEADPTLMKRCGEMINTASSGSFPNCFGACASNAACTGGSSSGSSGSSGNTGNTGTAAASPAPAANSPAAAASPAPAASSPASNNKAATGSSSSSSSGSGYKLADDYFGNGDFFSNFDFFTGADPTHGLVNFVSQSQAQSGGLINSTSSSAWMGADSKTVLTGNTGRNAVRISSKKSYTHMLVAIDVDEIPITCGGWPAFWSFGPNWPNNGEIDIIEGVHTQGGNQMTLHTSEGCSANGAGDGLLQPAVSNCEGNTGCGFKEPSLSSWQNVNKVGGGTWAMEWNSNGISIWWWGGGNKAPADVFGANPNPAGWGKPSMNVPNGNNCNIDQHFNSHNIVFDYTFCGDWAGSADVWAASGCSSSKYPTCQSYVQGNPSAYAGAGFNVNALKVYSAS